MWGAMILGGGSGQRMGAKCNKVLLPIAGKSMIVRSVEAFMPLVEQVVVVSREEDMPAMASELAQNGLDVPVVSGGATRQESVWRGLQALSGQCDGVLVHDGARCLVTADVIQRCMASVEECGTGVAARSRDGHHQDRQQRQYRTGHAESHLPARCADPAGLQDRLAPPGTRTGAARRLPRHG